MPNPTRQQVKKAIRSLARKTGLTFSQIRPTFANKDDLNNVIDLIRRTQKFEKRTTENSRAGRDSLFVDGEAWMAVPYIAPTITHSERGPSNTKLVESWEAFHKLFPNYPGAPHAQ